MARAPALQAGGRRFDSDYLHKIHWKEISGGFFLFTKVQAFVLSMILPTFVDVLYSLIMRYITAIAILIASFLFASCSNVVKHGQETSLDSHVVCESIMPITGTFLNLPYQDVRNKYTNPLSMDYTDPVFWSTKVQEMSKMGMEFLVLMAVANEGYSYYPSKLMPWVYNPQLKSPVDAIMDAAAENGMKVFMSTGWAKDQDDNLRDPAIKGRQIQMMNELAVLYGNHPAMYGWYLPVEDCFGPVLTDYAVDAVNALTDMAKALTPNAKVLISPYGIFNSNFDDPRYEQQIMRLKVDIIAYQDEIGCVREKYPLPRLRQNWRKLRAIHDKTNIEMWANCESFAWEKATNDRTSALIPASFSRLLSQLAVATEGGVDRIISFMMYGIYEDPSSPYQIAQPFWSHRAYEDYMAWKAGNRYWKTVEAALLGFYGEIAREAVDSAWDMRDPGKQEIVVELEEGTHLESVLVRMLMCVKDGIATPDMLVLSYSCDGTEYRLAQTKSCPVFPNTRHDAYVDHILFEGLDTIVPKDVKMIKLSYISETKTAIDRLIVNPQLKQAE